MRRAFHRVVLALLALLSMSGAAACGRAQTASVGRYCPQKILHDCDLRYAHLGRVDRDATTGLAALNREQIERIRGMVISSLWVLVDHARYDEWIYRLEAVAIGVHRASEILFRNISAPTQNGGGGTWEDGKTEIVIGLPTNLMSSLPVFFEAVEMKWESTHGDVIVARWKMAGICEDEPENYLNPVYVMRNRFNEIDGLGKKPGTLFGAHLVQLTLEYESRIGSEARGDNGGYDSERLKSAAPAFVVILLSALGIKLISDGLNATGKRARAGFFKFLLGVAAIWVAIPILMVFVVR